MKVRICFVLLISFPFVLSAQSDSAEGDAFGWVHDLKANLNLTQSTYDNWAAGGEDTFAWQFTLNNADTLFQENFQWGNTLVFDYGQTKIGGEDARKNVDEIDFESMFIYKLNVFLNPFVSVRVLTQIDDGFDYSDDQELKVSKLFEPLYITESFGVGYEPWKDFTTRLGLAVKHTIADEFAALYSDDPETPDEVETIRNEVGLTSVTNFKTNLTENIVFQSKLDLFSTLHRIDEVDVDWNNVLQGKLNEIISVNLTVRLLYDKDVNVNRKRQLKQVLAIGFGYDFW